MKPLIFFVHVPKAAGSTVNAHLHDLLPNGFSHCEAFMNIEDRMIQAANSCDWLSGHVDLGTIETILEQATDRPVRYFACMREPAKHVMSHYNWIIEIFHRGGSFYEGHPPRIKEISETIRSSPQDPASIAANLDRFAGLFLNTQSRIILGHKFNWNTGQIYQRLNRYEMIVDSGNVPALLSHLLDQPIERERKENVSRYHFDPAVFESDELKEFLRTRNTLDEILYEVFEPTAGKAS